LKVNECSAQLYVNEGLGHPYNTAVMRRIINNLGQALDPKIEGLGDIIIDLRPPDGYKTKAQLKAILKDKLDYDRVKDFLCVHTWSDPQVCNPVPLSEEAMATYHPELLVTRPIDQTTGRRITRYGRGRQLMWYEGGQAIDANLVYGYDELNPCWIDITSRAPVNINTAPREILIALLMDIEGFFVMPQLRTAGYFTSFGYDPAPLTFSYPAGMGYQGELGVLFRTKVVDRQMAEEIAKAIVERRSRVPFTTWARFEGFIDSLVGSVIVDNTRSVDELCFLPPDEIFYWYGYKLTRWDRYAILPSQALADAIKSNFNPNLHLNELNPDEAIWRWVDKTDLIRNSTEFCFLPTGYFEIESVGRILRAEWEPGRFHISPYLLIMKDSFEYNNQIMGQRRLKVEVKLWDLYREGVQKDFYKGNFGWNHSAPYCTDGNWRCQSGPELQNGPAPFENGYEGYVTLATIGGSMPQPQQRKKGKLYRTQRQEHDRSMSTMHAHYDLDFRLHYDTAGKIQPLTEGRGTGGVGDPGEPSTTYTSPYTPAYPDPDTGLSDRYRICRGYSYTSDLAPRSLIAPSDHRVDGWYAERFALLPYHIEGGNLNTWFLRKNEGWFYGAVSYWIKPNWMPEFAPYRKVFSDICCVELRRYCLQHDYAWGFSDILGGPVLEDTSPLGWTTDSFHLPYSMSFQLLESGGLCEADLTPTLNHIGHPGSWPGGCLFESPPPPQYTPFRAHHWILATLSWSMYWKKSAFDPAAEIADIKLEIHINGQRLTNSQQVTTSVMERGEWKNLWDFWNKLPWPQRFWFGGNEATRYSADATLDELYVWEQTLIPTTIPGEVPCGKKWEKCKGTCFNCTVPCNCPGVTHKCPVCPLIWCQWFNCKYCVCSTKITDCKNCQVEGCRREECRVDCRCPAVACPGCKELWCKRYGLGCPNEPEKVCGCKVSYYTCAGGCGKYFCKPGKNYPGCPNKDEGNICRCPCQPCGRASTQCKPRVSDDCTKLRDNLQRCKCDLKPRPECGAFGCEGGSSTACTVCMIPCDCKQPESIEMPTDEFEAEVKRQWWQGRYYRQNDAEFTSQAIDLAGKVAWRLAVPNELEDPYGGPRWTGKEGIPREGSERVWGKATSSGINILGMAWTWWGDVYDYKPTYEYLEPVRLGPQLEVSLYRVGADGSQIMVAGPFLNHDSGWAPVMVKLGPGAHIRYRVRFNTRCNPEDAVLLETPILDDLTIYYSRRPVFLSWQEGY
jgi:hypothetical protein